MPGNSIGTLFRVTTWGESHGPAIGVVIDGCPPRIPLRESDIQAELDRRKPGRGPAASPRKEEDRVEILSGTFEGTTTGTSLAMLIRNTNIKSDDYDHLRGVFRPGHGDITYDRKYGIRDHRGGGRASGRETAARVAAGAVAKKIVGAEDIYVIAYTKELGGIVADTSNLGAITRNDLCCPDPAAAEEMLQKLTEARNNGDTVGGIVEIIVVGCPAGLGEPVFDKMDADLAKALMSIGTVKGIEIGAGLQAAKMTGTECNDAITPYGFLGNNSGGILAGITTGENIVIRVACKPIPSIGQPQDTIDLHGRPVRLSVAGRHDVSVIPRIIPVCEAMVFIVLADHLLRQHALGLHKHDG